MSVPERTALLEDPESGEPVRVRFDALEPAENRREFDPRA
jgi:hypothetical protein